METMSEMHRAALRAAEGPDRLAAAVTAVARALYREPRRYGLSGEDEVGEIFARYGARLTRLVERFEDRGAPFEVYLRSVVRYYALSLRRTHWRASELRALGERSAALELDARLEAGSGAWLCAERPPDDAPEGSAAAKARRSLAVRAGYLRVKCASLLDDLSIERFAARAGLSGELLAAAVLAARARAERSRLRLERRIRLRDEAWARYAALERRLAREDDPLKLEYLRNRLEKERERFRRALELVRSTRTQLPNRSVAHLLGVPKGTVDAGLARMRRVAATLPAEGAFPLESDA